MFSSAPSVVLLCTSSSLPAEGVDLYAFALARSELSTDGWHILYIAELALRASTLPNPASYLLCTFDVACWGPVLCNFCHDRLGCPS